MSQFPTPTISRSNPPYPDNQDVSVEAVSGLTHKTYGSGPVKKTVFTLTDVALTVADVASTVGYVGQKLADFPAGLIHHLGSVADLGLVGSDGVVAAFDGDFGLGSVTASNNATLSSTEQNLIPTTATPQAVSGVTTAQGKSTATEATIVLDGTSTAASVFLNFLVDDADQAGGTLTVSGTVTVCWLQVGDLA